MANEVAKGDQNHYRVMMGVTNDTAQEVRMLRVDPATDYLLTAGGGGFALNEYDYISAAYPNATTEVYTFNVGGSGGITVNTITVVYTDSTKSFISNVTKV